eukprot:3635077-Pleurochrysis_carterae.AAC.1
MDQRQPVLWNTTQSCCFSCAVHNASCAVIYSTPAYSCQVLYQCAVHTDRSDKTIQCSSSALCWQSLV